MKRIDLVKKVEPVKKPARAARADRQPASVRIHKETAASKRSGPTGLELLAFGPLVEDDAEVVEDFWPQ